MKHLNYSKIKIARKSMRMSMDDLVNKMGDVAISKNSISRIERGLLRPSVRTLSAIADACGVPVSFFYEKDINIGNIDFRFDAKTPKKEVEQIKAMVYSEIQRYFSVEMQVEPDNDNFKSFRKHVVRTYEDTENAALYFRKKLEIGCQPIFSVYELLMNNGVHVIEMDIENECVLGLSTFVCKSRPVVIINVRTNKTVERKRFTALHELAHLVLKIQPVTGCESEEEIGKYKTLSYKVSVKPSTTERICHHFASAMLLPKSCLFARLGHVRRKLTLQELISIRNMYGISIAAIVHRAHDLAIIDDVEYDNLYDNLINNNIMETGWGGFPIQEKADRLKLLEERIRLEMKELKYNKSINRKNYGSI